MTRHDRLFPCPEGGIHTVIDILGSLSPEVQSTFDWDVMEVAMAELADPVAAVCLTLVVGSDRPLDIDGQPLGANKVMIELVDRAKVELVLLEISSCSAEWSRAIRVRTNSDGVLELFTAYSAVAANRASELSVPMAPKAPLGHFLQTPSEIGI